VLFARIGIQHCPQCGDVIGAQTAEQIVDTLLALPPGRRLMILAPLVQNRKGEHRDLLETARREGYLRARINGHLVDLEEQPVLDKKRKHSIEIVVDRLSVDPEDRSRLNDSVETALRLGNGLINVVDADSGEERLFSEHSVCLRCSLSLPPPTPQSFSFNNPRGMCSECGGLGTKLVADPERIIADPRLSIRQGAVAVWGDLTQYSPNSQRLRSLERLAEHFGFDLDTPYEQLPERVKHILLYGSGDEKVSFHWESENSSWTFSRAVSGLVARVMHHYLQTSSEAVRRRYARFISRVRCPACGGTRLNPASLAVRVGGRSIAEISALQIDEALAFFEELELSETERQIARDLLREIIGRLRFLHDVGLTYLTLERAAPSLSGGEAQRIRLASQIGSGLVGVLYIMDEPSIGLHARDNQRLLRTIERLRDTGNTVIVVEHDQEIILAADHVVDFGPGAGHRGGRIVCAGPPEEIKRHPTSLTGAYLSGRREIPLPERRRVPGDRWLVIEGATHNNLKGIDVRIPLGLLTCVTGVSGSGKSSLVNDILYRALARLFHQAQQQPGAHRRIRGVEHLDKVVNIDQKPIGRTPRSNPATYVKVFDPIRKLFSQVPEARMAGYKPGRFSFNVKGGRCETCEGAGVRRVEMHFLPDVFVTCEACNGRRFNKETLQIRYKGKSIADVLEMEVSEAFALFHNVPAIRRILKTLCDVGLDYIKLGQPATTLSGGEAQRVKLSRELARVDTGRTIYILDEPTTGLHFEDVKKLLHVLHRLMEAGNTVVVIEHNLEVIKVADYIVDLGPEGGDGGGEVVAEGPPEAIVAADTYTGRFLARVLAAHKAGSAAR
jgi:excinuclease ABC subunit A